eukprot:2314067-Amphidinium_carterae.4
MCSAFALTNHGSQHSCLHVTCSFVDNTQHPTTPVRWTPPAWTCSLCLGEAKNPGPPHSEALVTPARGPRRYLLHSDLQPDDVLRPGALLRYTRPNEWQSHLVLDYQSASRMWQWRDLSGKPP